MGRVVHNDKPLLKKVVEKILGSEYVEKIWKRIEIVGDIAVIRKPFDLSPDIFKAIGEELLNQLPYIKSVWLAVSPVHGAERIREYIHLAGEARSETVYKEYGCIFRLDITKVYFSPVLSYDHMRIARQVKKGEKVLNMFAGFGPYSVILSKYAQPSYVLSIDINDYAARYIRINIELNKVPIFNEVIHGDSLLIVPALKEKFDRILMPYPDMFEEAIDVAIKAVKDYGYIHPHLFIEAENKRQAFMKAVEKVVERISSTNISIEVVGGHVIRGVSPRKYHVAVDIVVKKSGKL
ncbi:MAG: class I SAM-dependent methyltransferase family protein [Ignisphaera sp.]